MSNELIHNPVTGETLRVLESNEDVFRVEFAIKPGGEIAGEHLHPFQDQAIFVLEGKLGVRIGETNYILSAGAAKVIPAGTRHFQWNEHDGETRAVEQFRPAGRAHDMFRVAFALAADGQTDAKGVLKPLIGAAFVSEFKDVVRPTSIGLRLIFGTLGPLSQLLGYRRIIRQYVYRFEREELHRTPLIAFADTPAAKHSVDRRTIEEV